MMNEEEKKAIDILINEIADIVIGEYCAHCKICENEDTECYYIKAIDTIYKLVNKQQKEIEILKGKIDAKEKVHEYDMQMIDELKGQAVQQQKEIEELKVKNKKLINPKDCSIRYYLNGEKQVIELANFIHKDKIREKIKELENIIEWDKPTYKETLDYTIDILKELLEEE